MEVKMTKKQYETLLKLVYLGHWMTTLGPEEVGDEFDKVQQYILSLAEEFGFKKHVGYDAEKKEYYPTEFFEEKSGVVTLVEEYNMYVVWEELMLSLSRRDLVEQYGAEAVAAMSEDDMIEKEYPILTKYEEEFRESGLQNLRIATKKGKS
jgi:hypothetical protein